jgi:hypothetical protein
MHAKQLLVWDAGMRDPQYTPLRYGLFAFAVRVMVGRQPAGQSLCVATISCRMPVTSKVLWLHAVWHANACFTHDRRMLLLAG